MQKEILEKHPKADVAVYAVWFSMFPGDSRSHWPSGLLTDPRVEHFWDEGKLAGRWYGSHVTQPGSEHVEWDAYFLYGPKAPWQEKPEGMVSWGRTVVASRERLREDLNKLLEEQASPQP